MGETGLLDFGMMSWQQFNKSRQPQPLYHPLDPVKNWFARQDNAQQPTKEIVIQPVVMKKTDMITYPLDQAYKDEVSGDAVIPKQMP